MARFPKLVLASAIVLVAFSAPAGANLLINPIFASNILGDPNASTIEGVINNAISIYEANFTDPIIVSIMFQEGGVLGSSSTFFGSVSYATYLLDLTADAKTPDDTTALAHLPSAATYASFFGTTNINIKTANARAVGIALNPPTGNPDGTITLNTSVTFPGSLGTSSTYSLLAVTEHEIDEVLGLGSALPSPPGGEPFTEDLYRYTSTPGVRSFTSSGSATAFFSIDGTADLAEFDNQADGGDYGDWRSSGTARVQDAVATPGATPSLGVELRALDVIGYDRVTVPEPGTAVLFAAALAVLAGLTRRCGV